MSELVCNLCGKPISGYGNNPDPLKNKAEDRCCDECNAMYVIPARMALRWHNNTNYRVGDEIMVLWLHDDPNAFAYIFKKGIIKTIDSIGQLHGTWGTSVVDPKVDKFVIVHYIYD